MIEYLNLIFKEYDKLLKSNNNDILLTSLKDNLSGNIKIKLKTLPFLYLYYSNKRNQNKLVLSDDFLAPLKKYKVKAFDDKYLSLITLFPRYNVFSELEADKNEELDCFFIDDTTAKTVFNQFFDSYFNGDSLEELKENKPAKDGFYFSIELLNEDSKTQLLDIINNYNFYVTFPKIGKDKVKLEIFENVFINDLLKNINGFYLIKYNDEKNIRIV